MRLNSLLRHFSHTPSQLHRQSNMSLCKHCVSGSIHEGTPKGKVEQIDGHDVYVATPSGDYPKDKVLLFLTDVFGLPLNNNKVCLKLLPLRSCLRELATGSCTVAVMPCNRAEHIYKVRLFVTGTAQTARHMLSFRRTCNRLFKSCSPTAPGRLLRREWTIDLHAGLPEQRPHRSRSHGFWQG